MTAWSYPAYAHHKTKPVLSDIDSRLVMRVDSPSETQNQTNTEIKPKQRWYTSLAIVQRLRSVICIHEVSGRVSEAVVHSESNFRVLVGNAGVVYAKALGDAFSISGGTRLILAR